MRVTIAEMTDDHSFGALVLTDEELDRLFGELCAGTRAAGGASRCPADVYLTPDPPTLVLELAVPGLDLPTLQVALDGDVLHIHGERKRATGEYRAYQHAEIDWGRFTRRLSLSRPVDAEAAHATYDAGILRLNLPLAQQTPVGRIVVAVRTSA